MARKARNPAESKEIENSLFAQSRLGREELFAELGTSEVGLNTVEADERLERFGPNVIEAGHQRTLWEKLAGAVINPFNVVLLIVLGVTVVTDIVISREKTYSTSALILATILISAYIGYSQEEKSNDAAQKLRKMITNKVDVIRNRLPVVVDITDVVPGDIVKLSSGDMLPGDVRFFEAKDLFVDQSSLTGESYPVEKFTEVKAGDSLTSLDNIGFLGTNVVSGSALAVVLSTGSRTYFGSMAKSLSTDKEVSDFEKGISSISRLLIRFMLVMVPVIFAVNLLTKANLVESILFGITITVGLIPEMLPVITTSTLAKGALDMSRRKTIIKKLSSIQTFGEMDVLCTDKTGTLTRDKIILEKYMDVEGNEDLSILGYAFLNSWFQTGLNNLIDLAIISRAEGEGLNHLKTDYERVDEIPFDFARRRMSVVLRDAQGSRRLITKGAVEEILAGCSFVFRDGQTMPLTPEHAAHAMRVYEEHNHDGLRMVAVAQKFNVREEGKFSTEDERDMTLVGFVGFLDPPKEGAKAAIAKLRDHGVNVVVLTGDSEGVAVNVCRQLDINVENRLQGSAIDGMSDEELKAALEGCNLLSKLTPFQKKRVVSLFQENGHTVGYLGDGINDAPPLKQSNVGISVDSAVDIAKETADIILLEKDLNVLEEGVLGGRRTFSNLSKYIKMATSGNFGNMISVIIASIFLPFLPLLPIHILIQNLLNDFAQLGMPFDNVDAVYLAKPKRIDTRSIRNYMFTFGFASTLFDVLCFLVLWYALGFNTPGEALHFQSGWFLFGIISQTLIIHIIRTQKIPFLQSQPSPLLLLSTGLVTAVTVAIGFTGLAPVFRLAVMPLSYLGWIAALMAGYALTIQVLKKAYIRRAGEWI